MNLIKLLPLALELFSKLKKAETPKVGETLADAGKQLIGLGTAVNVATATGAMAFLDVVVGLHQTAPGMAYAILISATLINIAPHIAGAVFYFSGKTQTTENSDKIVGE